MPLDQNTKDALLADIARLSNEVAAISVTPKHNLPPTISLAVSPVGGVVPQDVTLTAKVADVDGWVQTVRFLRDGVEFCRSTGPFTIIDPITVAGAYAYTAEAIDDEGAATMASSVSVTITDPAPTPTAGAIVQGILGDGADGVSRINWNKGLRLYWTNPGGDWLDAAGVAQGSQAFAALTVPALGKVTCDATAITRAWLATGNVGVIFRGVSGSSAFSSRHEPNAALRPVLIVTKPDGSTVACPCTADSVAGTSGEMPTGSTARNNVSPGFSLFMQFDLAGLALADVASAAIVQNCPQYTGLVAKQYLLNPPHIWTGYEPDDAANPAQGPFAAPTLCDREWDQALYDYPHSTAYDPAFFKGYLGAIEQKDAAGNIKSAAAPGIFGSSPDMGRYVETKFDPAVGNGECLMELDHFIPDPGPDELYMLAKVKLIQNWPPHSSTGVAGGKLPPALAGRYGIQGILQDPLAWMAVGANGQDCTDGRVHWSDEPGGSSVWSPDGKRRKVTLGWSCRTSFGDAILPDNPYQNLVAPHCYVYWADMPRGGTNGWQGSGQNFRWGNVCLRTDLAYDLQIGVKMNSIDMSAPDANGNGVGRFDGTIRVMVNKVEITLRDWQDPSKPMTPIRFRHHPSIRIVEVWPHFYLGGSVKPIEVSTMQVGRVAASTSVIGP